MQHMSKQGLITKRCKDELHNKRPYSMPICYAKISMLTENHMERNLSKIKTIIISQDPAAMINLKTIQMTFH